MSRIHTLANKLTLNTSNFTTGLEKARRGGKAFLSDTRRITGQLVKMGGVANLVSVGGLALLTKHHLSAIDAQAKFADELGVSTEALAGYYHAAELTGTKQETVDKGLQRLVRRLGEAKQGYGEGVKGLDALGLSAEEFANKTPEQALGLISDRLNQQTDAATRASTAYALFGRQGQEMLNFLALGSEGLAETAAEADALGLSFSRVDAAKVEAANDAITRTKAVVTGAGQSFTVALAPYIEAAAKKMLDLGMSGEGMSSTIVSGVQWVTSGIATVTDWMGYFEAAFHGARAVVTAGLGWMAKGWALVGKATEAVVNLMPGVKVKFSDNLSAMGDELIETAKKSAKAADEAFADAMEGKNSKRVAGVFEDIRKAAEENAKTLAANAEARRSEAAETAHVIDALEQEAKAREKVSEQITEIDKQIRKLGMSEIEIKLDELKEIGATNEELDQARRKLEQIDSFKASAEVSVIVDDLDQQIKDLGLNEEQKLRVKLEGLGASKSEIDEAINKLSIIEDMEFAKELSDAATSPADKLEAEVERIKALYSKGMIDFDTFDHAMTQVEDRYEQAQEKLQPRDVDLIRAGSADAQRLAFLARRDAPPIIEASDTATRFADRSQGGLGIDDTRARLNRDQSLDDRLTAQTAPGLQKQDETPRQQLEVQRQMAASLYVIAQNSQNPTILVEQGI